MARAKEYIQYIARGISPSYDIDGLRVLNQKCIRNQVISFNESRFTNIAKKKIANEKYLQNYDVLINSTGVGTLGRVAQIKNIKVPTTVDSHVTIVRPNLKKINGDFFGYCFKAQQKLIETLGVGATGQIELSRVSILENVEIPEYSLKQQKNIAKILSNYDDLIENNNKRIKILEEIAQKIYKEWFVDFKFPGYETTTFKQTDLGKIPNNWEIKQIGKEYKTYLGGTPSRNEEKYWNGKIPWLNSGKTNELRITKASEYVTELGLEKSSTKLMPQYTTVLAITGATLGQVSMLGSEMCANQSVVGIYSDKNPEYVFYLMKDKIQKLIQSASGGAQQHINKDIVNEMKFVLPADTMLNDFKNIIRPINKEIFNLLYKNYTLKQTRDILLPRLISGEIDVENLEIL